MADDGLKLAELGQVWSLTQYHIFALFRHLASEYDVYVNIFSVQVNILSKSMNLTFLSFRFEEKIIKTARFVSF